MQRLEDRDEVVAAGQLGIRGVPAVERHPVIHAACGQELLSSRDRGLIEVDPVDRDLGVGAGDRDARPAEPARNVGDTRRRIAIEAIVDGRHSGQPVGREEVVEQRLGEARLALVEVGAVVGVRDSVAGSERGEHGVDRQGTRDEQLSHRGHVVEAARVEQDLVVAGGHGVAAFGVRGVGSTASRMPVIACCSSHSRA